MITTTTSKFEETNKVAKAIAKMLIEAKMEANEKNICLIVNGTEDLLYPDFTKEDLAYLFVKVPKLIQAVSLKYMQEMKMLDVHPNKAHQTKWFETFIINSERGHKMADVYGDTAEEAEANGKLVINAAKLQKCLKAFNRYHSDPQWATKKEAEAALVNEKISFLDILCNEADLVLKQIEII